jgi:hypothetical protein
MAQDSPGDVVWDVAGDFVGIRDLRLESGDWEIGRLEVRGGVEGEDVSVDEFNVAEAGHCLLKEREQALV